MTSVDSAVLPFYVAVDVSISMRGGALTAANALLPTVAAALSGHARLSDRVRFALLDFADDSVVLVPLGDLARLQYLPALSCRGGTAFGKLFQTLRGQIASDLDQLRADGYRVHRPAVFLVTDGQPTDDGWQDDFRSLTDYDVMTGVGFREYPLVVPCGVGDVDLNVLQSLVHPLGRSRMYVAKTGIEPEDAINALAEVLVSSIVGTDATVARGRSGVHLPNADEFPSNIGGRNLDMTEVNIDAGQPADDWN